MPALPPRVVYDIAATSPRCRLCVTLDAAIRFISPLRLDAATRLTRAAMSCRLLRARRACAPAFLRDAALIRRATRLCHVVVRCALHEGLLLRRVTRAQRARLLMLPRGIRYAAMLMRIDAMILLRYYETAGKMRYARCLR